MEISIGHRSSTTAALIALMLFLASAFTLPASAQVADNKPISAQAMGQITALLQEKASRTPLQQKISSRILYELGKQRGQFAGSNLPSLAGGVIDKQNRAKVDIRATVTDDLISKLKALGVEVLSKSERYDSISANVPLGAVESVAALPEVRFVARDLGAATHTWHPVPGPGSDRPALAMRTANVRAAIGAALLTGAATNVTATLYTGQGSVSSEGDITHRAVDARNTFHVDGTGVKIGVLSDGVDGLAQSEASGDLPNVTVLPGQAGSGGEGTAMLEIIHDLAPGAQLYFASAFGSISSFAQNIRDLRSAGCDIIVDDVFYYVESPFQDGQTYSSQYNGGVVTQAVKDVTASGALYFSSAGNEGNIAQGTGGVWEGDFKDGGAVAVPISSTGETGRVHDFGGGQTYNVYGSGGPVILHWNDALGQSSNDYDLFVLNSAGTSVTDFSVDSQGGAQDPLESVNAPANGSRLVIVKYSGAGRFLHLNTFRGTLSKATNGQTHGHSAADSIGAFSVAATPAAAPFGSSTAGPYPNPFTFAALEQTETFESDGRRRVFYNGDGSQINSNLTATGGKLLNKPDITAADGVSVTGVGGFGSPFYGTSAAAPHAGAVAALVKQALPGYSQAQLRNLLVNNTIDLLPFGYDVNSGYGIVMPWQALKAANVPGTADIEPGVIVATENPGDGDGVIAAGEGGKLAIPLRNVGVLNATNIKATLTSSTPGVTIYMPNTNSYPNLLAQTGTATTNYLFTLDTNLPCPQVIDFTLTVNYTGGTSPRTYNFTVPTGSAAISINTTLDTTAPPSTTFYAASTGLQNGRISRPGFESTCSAPQPFGGYIDTAHQRRYDAYSFNTCSNSVPSCVQVSITSSNNSVGNLLGVGYLGAFNPGDVGQNYAATNSSGGFYSFLIPGGAQNFTTVVDEVNPGAALGTKYTLNVSGACVNSCVVNHPPVAKVKDVTVVSGYGCTAAASVDAGSYDPDPGDKITITQTPPGPYPVGVTPVTLTVTDSKGAFSQATANVTVLAKSQSSLSAATIYVPPVKARITLTDLVYAQCEKVPATGTVTFTDAVSGAVLGTAPIHSTGQTGTASITIERVRPVNMVVNATYSGDSNTAGSQAGPKVIFAY